MAQGTVSMFLLFLVSAAAAQDTCVADSSDDPVCLLQLRKGAGEKTMRPWHEACADKAVDDACEFTGKKETAVTGTCQEHRGGMVCKPSHHEKEGGGGRLEACADKTPDDACEFTGKEGDTGTGTCHQIGDKMLCVPAKKGGGGGGKGDEPKKVPPPLAACADKTPDETCEFTGKDETAVTGTCQEKGDKLKCKPAKKGGGGGGGKGGEPKKVPPPLAACADKTPDDGCEFTGKEGSAVTGTCQEKGDKLRCVPAKKGGF